jgi:hypothetical protein
MQCHDLEALLAYHISSGTTPFLIPNSQNNLPLTCYPSYSNILDITEPKEHAKKHRKKKKQ